MKIKNLNLFKLFEKKDKKKVLFLFILMGFASILELLSLGMILPISTLFISPDVENNQFINFVLENFSLPKESLIYFFIFIFSFIYLFKIIFLVFISWYEQKFLNNFKFNLSNKFFKNYINKDYSFFIGKNTSEFLRNIMSEIDHLIRFYMSTLLVSLETIILSAIFIFLLFINPYVTVITFLIFLVVGTIYISFFNNNIKDWGYTRQSLEKKRIQFLQEGFGAVKEIKMMEREIFFYSKFFEQNLQLANISLKINFLNQLPRHILEFFAILTIVIIFTFLSKTTIQFSDTFSILALYLAAAFRIMPSSNRVMNNLQMIKFCYPAVEVLTKEAETFEIDLDKGEKKKEIISFNSEISVDIKKFSYPNNKKFEVKNIFLKIPINKKIGIIGTSGSGKSTIVEIITGILKPNIGDLKVDGKSIHGEENNWKNKVAYIPQKIFILDDTLKNNILFGAQNKDYNDKYIIELLKKTNLYDLFKRLPSGLKHNLGEKGLNLSGGEIQRVGIARALVGDPQIIILDEATSSLDTFTENNILEEIYKLKNKTIISVAHRIGTLKKSDIIYRVENGEIIDSGNFEKFNK
jgi:ATP-binding cassette, subfamily B, bacterial PglK